MSLWFEVLGTKRVADGPRFVERPTIITVHGGPGFDSANGLQGAMPLSDFAQVVVFDQRGHGRSDYSRPDRWNLDTWADDIVALCAALEIERPIVLGTSFGGFVVQRYAARHPDRALAHILAVTVPRFDDDQIVERFRALGGNEVADLVRRRSRPFDAGDQAGVAEVVLAVLMSRSRAQRSGSRRGCRRA